MYWSKTGGVIAIANSKRAMPFEQIGEVSAIKRLVLVMQQFAIFPIVMITTPENNQAIKDELSALGVVFIVDKLGQSQMLEAFKIGLQFLKDKTEKIVLSPVNTPYFSTQTLFELLSSDTQITIPSYQNRNGHPVVISTNVLESLFSYQGENGLRGYIKENGALLSIKNVDDKGIFHQVHQKDMLDNILYKYNKEIYPKLRLQLTGKEEVFDNETKLLLVLIECTGSVKQAQNLMNVSLSKCWKMLNALEESLHYAVIERQQGGSFGGKTRLTKRGYNLVKSYQKIEEDIALYAYDKYLTL